MKRITQIIGYVLSLLLIPTIIDIIHSIKINLYTGFYKNRFERFGIGTVIVPSARMLEGLKYISVGKHCIIGSNIQLTAYDQYISGQRFNPSIIIHDNVEIGDGSHITCINKIEIGNNVLTGRYVLITDNSHGSKYFDQLSTPPVLRLMKYKGAIIIEDNVWIGEKATITAGVTIGANSIIGANCVITKDVPPYSLAVGSPARYISLDNKKNI